MRRGNRKNKINELDVVCINNKNEYGVVDDKLIINNTYKVHGILEISTNSYKNYYGLVGVDSAFYPKKNFITLLELRRLKINKLLNVQNT